MKAAGSASRRGLRTSHPGQAVVWVAVTLPLFLAVIGLAIDGGIAFADRRELQNVADGAARAGAMQIDQAAYRASAGQTVVLDAESAQQTAATYVADQGGSVAANVSADSQHVVVSTSRVVPTSFLRIVGITSMRISATATAAIHYGIATGSR